MNRDEIASPATFGGEARNDEGGIDISIVILAKNEEGYIGDVLDKVFSQDIDRNFEVIVIDSGSRDGTLDIARSYPVEIVEIHPEEFGHGRTRNKGAQISKGGIVVFLNADAVPKDENWLRSLISNFKDDNNIAGVYSRAYPRVNCNPLRSWEILNDNAYHNSKKIKYIEDFDEYLHMNPRDKRKLLAFYSISCALKRDILLKFPFKDIKFGEDMEWSKRIMEKGYRIVFEPNSKIEHSHNFYHSIIKTFKKYSEDARLNNELLSLWTWRNFPMLIAYIVYKLIRDIGYVLALDKKLTYKIGWIFYSPIIRLAEFLGIVTSDRSHSCGSRNLKKMDSHFRGNDKKRV